MPNLSRAVPHFHQPQPRDVIATDAERAAVLEGAQPALRFFLLLCSDLGLRHKTAARISLGNYNRELQSLTFTTKGNVHQTLPVTPALAIEIESMPAQDTVTPIVNLIRGLPRSAPVPRFTKQWDRLKRQLSIRPELRIHDLRRTLAEDVWNATHDLRAVQAQLGHRSPTTTARYLANRVTLQDLEPVMRKVQAIRAARAQQKEIQQAPGRKEQSRAP